MGTFGRSFINVLFPAYSIESNQYNFDEGPTLDLHGALPGLIARLSLRGGILYFPIRLEGRPYELVGPTPGTVFLIPENITLKFAPGAMINPSERAVLLIRGGIDAGPFPIFGTQANVGPGRPTQAVPPRDGRVILASDRIPHVRPEWFGALSSSGAAPGSLAYDCSEAFQAAIDAAVVLRGDRPSIPLLLGGEYNIDRPLVVGDGPGQGPALPEGLAALRSPGNALLLRGTHGLGASGIKSGQLRASSNFRGRDTGAQAPAPPMLTLRGDRGLDISSVHFAVTAEPGLSAAQRASATVLVELPGATQGAAVSTRQLRFSHCTFTGGRVASVALVGPLTDPDASPPTRLTKVTFDQCFFDVVGESFTPEGQAPPPLADPNALSETPEGLPSNGATPWTSPRALYVRGPSSLTVDLETSNFMGQVDRRRRFRAFVHAEGGAVLLEGCTLHGTSNPTAATMLSQVTRGVDVALERPGVGEQNDPDLLSLVPEALRVFPLPRPDLVPTALTLLQVESQSLSLLARGPVSTRGVTNYQALHRNAVVIGTRHSAVVQSLAEFPGVPAPSSVLWRSEGGPTDGALVLISSRFSHDVEVSASTLRGTLVSAGCSWVTRSETDPFVRIEGTTEPVVPLQLLPLSFPTVVGAR